MIELDFARLDGLLQAVLQDVDTDAVLALGLMNRAALLATLDSGRATLLDRRSGHLFVPGESSGDYARVLEVHTDCDHAALLVRVHVQGEGLICERGSYTCFTELVAVARRDPPFGAKSTSHLPRRKDDSG